MSNLTKASRQLYGRKPDECVEGLPALLRRCREQKAASLDRWQLPKAIEPVPAHDGVGLRLGAEGTFGLNDWSFTQLCKMAGVSKDTLNKLTPGTAAQALAETLPVGKKPTQVLTEAGAVRSVHGTNYSRLWNADLVEAVADAAGGFGPPPRAYTGATGLYLGEQDVFAFLVDPDGWCEVDGEAFAPGFFVWNSEVGRRSVGIQTFWFQAVCQNHIVWDATEIEESVWTHTAKVDEAVPTIKALVAQLARKRDERKDTFVRVLKRAAEAVLGADADEVLKVLGRHGIPAGLGRMACEQCHRQGKRFTIFALVDALTQLNREVRFAGDRTDADVRAASLLKLVFDKGDAIALPALSV
jgi:hypothetical protein